jgi:hypothetical protein
MQETFRITTPELPSPYIDEQIGRMEYQFQADTPLTHEVGHIAVEAFEARRPREAAAREVAAEIWTNASPFRAENDAFFGSPEDREAAAETVTAIADQARLTGKYLDGSHKALSRKLDAGEITKAEHDEAVGGILTGFALTNPQHLRNVESAQQRVIERRVKAGVLPEDTKFVNLTSRVSENGVELAGIDAVVARMTGRTSQADIAAHGLEIKKAFYGEEALAKATARHQKQQSDMMRAAIAKAQERHETIMHILDREEQDDKKSKYDTAA